MSSYERLDAGLGHDLVVLLKGFPDADSQRPYRDRADRRGASCVELPDAGQDLAAYAAAAASLPHERLCFVNSFSEIRAHGWLALLDAALSREGVGAAGATGSWASQLSWRLFQLGLGGRYSEVISDRRAAGALMHSISGDLPPRAVKEWIVTLMTTLRRCRGLERFPAIHLRTNGFMIERRRFGDLGVGTSHTKWDAYRVESGTDSITRRLRALGELPVVVDRDGTVREPPDWHAGDVFWQRDQSALLIADNQTRVYERATPDQRELLSQYAWGSRARPA